MCRLGRQVDDDRRGLAFFYDLKLDLSRRFGGLDQRLKITNGLNSLLVCFGDDVAALNAGLHRRASQRDFGYQNALLLLTFQKLCQFHGQILRLDAQLLLGLLGAARCGR